MGNGSAIANNRAITRSMLPSTGVAFLPKAMAEIAERNGAVSVVDNTFASPWGRNPIKMGFDIVLHSGTKYLGGHADLIAGLVAGKKELIADIFFSKIHYSFL